MTTFGSTKEQTIQLLEQCDSIIEASYKSNINIHTLRRRIKQYDLGNFYNDKYRKLIIAAYDQHPCSNIKAAKWADMSYHTFINRAKKFNIYTAAHNSTRIQNKTKVSLTEILEGKHPQYSRGSLKQRLLEEGIFEYKCNACGVEDNWNNKPLVLQLEHKNGINNDNRLENLEFLCPNCHSQTDTFCGKNVKRSIKDRVLPNDILQIYTPGMTLKLICSKVPKLTYGARNHSNYIKEVIIGKYGYFPKYTYTRRSISPRTISESNRIKRRKVIRPSSDELQKMLWDTPTTHIAKAYNVSDNCIARWAKEMNLTKPPRGYWQKKNGKL